jgi:hypothetical protein
VTDSRSKLDQFAKRSAAIDARMIEIEQLRREFTVLAAEDDQAALQRIMKLDAEATNLRRELSLLSDAAAEIRHQQVQAAEAAAKQEREQREAEGRKLAVEVQSVNHQIDTTLIQVRQMFQRRAELIGALNNCKIMNAGIGKVGAAFRSLGDPLWDTSNAQGRLLSTLLAGIAEFERELIRERTGEGRKRAMAAGVKFGRKPKLSDYQRKEAIKRRAAGETLASIAKSYAVDISMISRL